LRTNLIGWRNEVVGTSGVILLWDLQGQLFQDHCCPVDGEGRSGMG
jgi:hypothetical protein